MQINRTYQIIVKGRLDNKWDDWFDGMIIDFKGENTVFTGKIKDQPALHGYLNKIRDLGLIMVSVQITEDNDKLR